MFKLQQINRAAENSVVLVHSIFRHGNRTPDKAHIYPKDPYINLNFQPDGYGQLTNKGKEQSYLLGRFLRDRYNNFLGDTYYPGIVDPWSSSYERTKVVLMLALAAMFPPKGDQVWNSQLNWQPIPFRCTDERNQCLFLNVLKSSKAKEAYSEYLESLEGRNVLDKHQNLFSYLSEQTGWKIYSTRDVLYLATTLNAEETAGLKLPKWTEGIWPKHIEDVALLDYVFMTANATLKSYNVGLLLQKIVDDTKLKINEKSDCKMHIYSGHDINVAMLMRCLNIFYAHVPQYCALLLLELHKIEGVYGFKIFYQESSTAELKLFTIPNCPSFCPVDKFVGVIQDILDENQRIHFTTCDIVIE